MSNNMKSRDVLTSISLIIITMMIVVITVSVYVASGWKL